MSFISNTTTIDILIASIPILVLILGIIVFKWNAAKAGSISLLLAISIALFRFGSTETNIVVAASKGISLSIFVLTVIWSSVFMYNILYLLGFINVIGSSITRLIKNPLAQALVVGWAFGGLIQGVSGFGVPVAVVAPLMILMGFSAPRAAAIALIGHCWATTFGSLGSSFYTLQLVTDLPSNEIGPHMAILFTLPIILCGFAVAHIQGGIKSVIKGMPAILIIGLIMSFSQWLAAYLNVPQIGGLVAGLSGTVIGWLLTLTPILNFEQLQAESISSTKPKRDSSDQKEFKNVNFHLAFSPYYLVLLISLISQIPVIKSIPIQFGLDYPINITGLGYYVKAEQDYAGISLFSHPAPIIMFATLVTYAVYKFKHIWVKDTGIDAFKRTYKQCVPSSLGLLTMVMMSLIMIDSGMTSLLGNSIAKATTFLFPIFSPFIGVLGTFLTGSNTNSNVMFGALQVQTATALELGVLTIASSQSIGGALGGAIAPAKVLVGTTLVGLSGQEHKVLKKSLPYCMIILVAVGIQALIISFLE